MVKYLICALALAASSSAMANNQAQLSLNDSDDFRAQRTEIEKGLSDGETYTELTSTDRAKVRESLERISSRLDGKNSIEDLQEAEKVDLYNDQELVNTILTQAREDSRMVCDRTKPTGSHRYKNTCQTVAARRRRLESDQDHLKRVQNGIGQQNN